MPQLPPAREAARLALLDKKNVAKDEIVVTAPVRKGEYALLSLNYETYVTELERIQQSLAQAE